MNDDVPDDWGLDSEWPEEGLEPQPCAEEPIAEADDSVDDEDLETLEAAALAALLESGEPLQDSEEWGAEDTAVVAEADADSRSANAPARGKRGKPFSYMPMISFRDDDDTPSISSVGDKAGRESIGSQRNGTGPGKGGKKGAPQDGGVAQRILKLNKAGLWPAGKGIDTRALALLRKLPLESALEIIKNIEGSGDKISNPSSFISSQAKKVASVEVAVDKAPRAVSAQVSSDTGAMTNGAPETKRARTAESSSRPEDTVKMPQVVRDKVSRLNQQGVTLALSAVEALAGAAVRDALFVLKALEAQTKVENPSRFVTANLLKRQETEERNQESAVPHDPGPPAKRGPTVKIRVADVDIGKVVSKAQLTQTTPAKPTVLTQAQVLRQAQRRELAKAKAAKPVDADITNEGRAPQIRDDLEFEQAALQAHIQAFNNLDHWPQHKHAVDEAAFSAMLKISAQRAMEILNEVEEEPDAFKDPSEFIRSVVTRELIRSPVLPVK